MDNLFAYTGTAGSYPGYVSINRTDNGDVRVTVRGSPSSVNGVRVCSHKPGPGNCTPGDVGCNNYCNLAPQVGPMADQPLAFAHVREGVTASFDLRQQSWEELLSSRSGS